MASRMNAARKRRMGLYSLIAIVSLAFLLPLGSYSVHWLGNQAVAQEAGAAANPRSNYWRAVKEGVSGYSAVQGPESGVLITSGGTEWQQMREGPVAKYLPWAIVGVLAIVLLYHLIHGRNKLDANQLSGRKLKRWNGLDRTVHWITALSFIALAITGLSMLIGKNLLIPVLGKAGFSWWAQTSITIHNVLGPVFTIGIVMMILLWIWHNFPAKGDLQWLKAGGGMFKRTHPSAGRMNAGEKIWYWFVVLFGLAVCVTGLIMLAPIYGIAIPDWAGFVPLVEGSRGQMQQANLVHAAVSLIWAALAIGHIYIGTAGTEGAFEGMKTGYVSEEWAKQHHDLWHEKQVAKGKLVEAESIQVLKRQPGSGVSAEPASAR
ncbi:MAG: formate dehydrogenase subunit gamma [Granulosicoccus sp.]|nr:formate dehydrogenase subunit gamma [Granulosicoccus sp.]